jgi:hypothetical protein
MYDNILIFERLPEEIIQKIQFFSHNTMSKELQNEIKNFRFDIHSFLDNSRLCVFCRRYHRYPRHFRC